MSQNVGHGPLGTSMVAWRLARGLDVDMCIELAGRGTISKATWSKLENGHRENYKPTTFAAVDRAFGWQVGDALEIWEGKKKPPPPPNGEQRASARTKAELAQMRRDIDDLAAVVRRLERLLPRDQ